MNEPRITVAVPSFNQGRFLDAALKSIFDQDIEAEVFVTDGGSTDESLQIIEKWKNRLTGWRSHPDNGQAAAINEGIARGRASFVCWLNSDDWLLPGGLAALADELEKHPDRPAVYGRTLDFDEGSQCSRPAWVEPFDVRRLAVRCFISQPGTLIRRSAWDALGGLDGSLHMAMDYDLWWRMNNRLGPLHFLDRDVAVNRIHAETKTSTLRALHYREAIGVVRRHYGRVPLKWWFAQPYKVWWKAGGNYLARYLS